MLNASALTRCAKCGTLVEVDLAINLMAFLASEPSYCTACDPEVAEYDTKFLADCGITLEEQDKA